MSQRPLPAQPTTLTRHRQPCPRRESNPKSSMRVTRDVCLRPRGHWERQVFSSEIIIFALENFIIRVITVRRGFFIDKILQATLWP
jgi:hypothetical protein